jgi:hypothetical protein
MPKYIFSYIRGLVQSHKVTATALSRQFNISHDGITRMLTARFPWKQLFIMIVHRLFGILTGGYLIIDDTVLAKPYGRKFHEACFAYSSSLQKTVFGYHIVIICWTNGVITIPLSWCWYRKGKYTKVELAMLLLEEIRWKWRIKNCIVLYDSWYAAAKVIKLIRYLGYHFVSQIKKNRKVNNVRLSKLSVPKNRLLAGKIAGEIQAYFFRNEDKYYATSLSALSPKQVHILYKIRWKIEEVFRFLKTVLKLEKCQAIRITAQKIHLVSCMIAYLIFQKEQTKLPELSMYQIYEKWFINKHIGRCRINHYVKVLGFTSYC